MTGIQTTCPYCGVGCGVIAEVEGEKLIKVSGDEDHPANHGRLCIKGSSLPETQYGPERLLHPLVDGQRVEWDKATHEIASRLATVIDEHGPESVAFYLSGQLLTEDYYVANKLMKGFIGSANVDTNSRLCMASAVAAHKRAFGEDVVPCNYADIEQAALFVLVGSNTAWAHPVIYQRISKAVQDRGAKVVVIDPRRTPTCDIASMHLAINPGTDVILFNGLLSFLCDNGAKDNDFLRHSLSGFTSTDYSIARVAKQTGLNPESIETFYKTFCEHEKTLTMFSQGVNQSQDGTDKCNAVINCHLVTGRIGQPGMGPFSLTGQPNAMGGREVGGMANQLAAHMAFETDDIDRVGRFWQSPNMAHQPGEMAVDLFRSIAAGKIKAVWIMGTNPAVSLPESNLVNEALSTCPLVIVSDTVANTDTTRYADILLPAQGWGEKDGTVTNSERCISRQRAFLAATGEARADWSIVCDVAKAMGFTREFNYAGPHEIFSEHARLSGFENDGSRLFNISALGEISKDEYDQLKPTSWPLDGRPFQSASFQHDDRKARFIPIVEMETERADRSADQFVLNTGRLRDQWHTMTRTGAAAKLFQHQRHPWLEINEEDASRLGVTSGQLVLIGNDKGSISVPVRISEEIKTGELFLPMHWNRSLSSLSANSVVHAITDPISGQPALKSALVELNKVEVAAWCRIVTTKPMLQAKLDTLAVFWTRAAVRDGYLYDLALEDDSFDALIDVLEYSNPVTGRFDYRDSFNGTTRVIGHKGDRAAWFAGLSPGPLLDPKQTDSLPEQIDWRSLSSLGQPNREVSTCICTCFEVSEDKIRQAIIDGSQSLEQLGEQLRCGTNCGSCIPEINRLLQQAEPAALTAIGVST